MVANMETMSLCVEKNEGICVNIEFSILYTACGKYPQWMHDKLVGYAEREC